MRLIRRLRRPSPAFVVAVLALLVAAGVPAYAASLLTGANIKNRSLHGKDLARGTLSGYEVKDHSLKPVDFKGSVQGPPGPAGTAVAFAHVSAGGILDIGRSKGVAKVTRPAEGLFCFFLVPPVTVRNVSATLDRNGTQLGFVVRGTAGPGASTGNPCSGLESASVRVYNAANVPKNDGIYVDFN